MPTTLRLFFANFLWISCPSLLLACTETTLVNIVPTNGHYNAGTKDYSLQGHVIRSLTTRNILLCANKCTKDETCKSFNYSPDSRACDLNSETHETQPVSFVSQLGSEYYSYDWSQFTDCSFSTPNTECFEFIHPRLPDGTTRIEFSVKTSADAFIALSSENRMVDPDPLYVIDIGGNGGGSIFLRLCKGCGNTVNQVITDPLLSDQEYRRFWITWENGLIRMGRNHDTASLIEWQDPNPLDVHYIGFASWYAYTADWQLHSFCDAPWEW